VHILVLDDLCKQQRVAAKHFKLHKRKCSVPLVRCCKHSFVISVSQICVAFLQVARLVLHSGAELDV
jgi:hypothetical protein